MNRTAGVACALGAHGFDPTIALGLPLGASVRTLVPDGAVVLARRDFGTRVIVAASLEQYVAYYPAWLRARGVYVVSFDDALTLPGYRCTTLKRSSSTVYRITRT